MQKMEVMRKFIIELKPDGTMKWAEVCDQLDPQKVAYKKILEYCEVMEYLYRAHENKDKYEAYHNVAILCKRLGNLR